MRSDNILEHTHVHRYVWRTQATHLQNNDANADVREYVDMNAAPHIQPLQFVSNQDQWICISDESIFH